MNPIPESNFAYLYQNIFRPTCANSGCHDGTFPPDFRTIVSSYNAIVYQPVITNDAQNTFTYRVAPGNSAMSLLYERLVTFIPNTSGIMPAVVDPDSDWNTRDAEYIAAIKAWIDGGALDMFGNAPSLGNLQPQVVGVQAFPTGTTATPYPRPAGPDPEPMTVPFGSTVDVWLAFEDDDKAANQIPIKEVLVSKDLFGMTDSTTFQMQIVSPIQRQDFLGNTVDFTHKATLDLSSFIVGTPVFFRVYVDESVQGEVIEIPNEGTDNHLIQFAFMIN